jgi:hypothetical protein
MKLFTLRSATAALLITAFAFSSSVRPAKADTTSTLLITAAAVAAIATGINVAEKSAKANTVVGYLRNGSVVYADGHVVAPNGQSWYPGNYNQSIACNGQYCSIVNNTYDDGYTNGYPAYQTSYDNFVPAYTGYAPVFTGFNFVPGYSGYTGYNGYNGYNGGTYVAPNRTVNIYKTTQIVHRPAPIVVHDPIVVHHDPIVVHHDPIIVRKDPIVVRHDPVVVHRNPVVVVPERHLLKPRQ